MYSKEIEFDVAKKLELLDITEKVKEAVKESGIQHGLVSVYTKHTTSAIRINENEPLLMEDMKHLLESLVPSSHKYHHDNFEKRNCPPNERINGHSHLKALLLGTSETIPIMNSELCLGKWQSVFYVDLDGGNRKRKIIIQILGDK